MAMPILLPFFIYFKILFLGVPFPSQLMPLNPTPPTLPTFLIIILFPFYSLMGTSPLYSYYIHNGAQIFTSDDHHGFWDYLSQSQSII